VLTRTVAGEAGQGHHVDAHAEVAAADVHGALGVLVEGVRARLATGPFRGDPTLGAGRHAALLADHLVDPRGLVAASVCLLIATRVVPGGITEVHRVAAGEGVLVAQQLVGGIQARQIGVDLTLELLR
jgi:hypothetical protein